MKEAFNAADYWVNEEGVCHLMGEWRRRWHDVFSPTAEVAGGGLGGGARPSGDACSVSAWGGRRRPAGLGGPKGWVGRLAAGPIGPEAEKKSFQNRNWNFKVTKALKICIRRFRRNFDTRIFPKFF
jgi:hypothetical protein